MSNAQEVIKREEWGRDHWSLLSYLETRCVDYGGLLAIPHLRSDGERYPTKLRDGSAEGHNDFDCIDDLEAAGLIVNLGTGINPKIELTDNGWSISSILRRFKSKGGSYAQFAESRHE